MKTLHKEETISFFWSLKFLSHFPGHVYTYGYCDLVSVRMVVLQSTKWNLSESNLNFDCNVASYKDYKNGEIQ